MWEVLKQESAPMCARTQRSPSWRRGSGGIRVHSSTPGFSTLALECSVAGARKSRNDPTAPAGFSFALGCEVSSDSFLWLQSAGLARMAYGRSYELRDLFMWSIGLRHCSFLCIDHCGWVSVLETREFWSLGSSASWVAISSRGTSQLC